MKQWACVTFDPNQRPIVKEAFETKSEAQKYLTGEKIYIYQIGEWHAFPTNRPGSIAKFLKVFPNLEVKITQI